MKNKLIILIATMLAMLQLNLNANAISEDGEIRGKITNKETGEPVPFASIAIIQGLTIVNSIMANDSGEYKLKGIKPGTYNLQASFQGFNKTIIENITVDANRITFANMQLSTRIDLPIAKVRWIEPLIKKDDVISGATMSGIEIKQSPYTDVKDFAAATAGVFQKEEGGSLNIRGGRSDATQYYIDGIRVIGGASLPKRAIASIKVMTGGIPAQYGDVTGGIVVITTKSSMGNGF